MQADSVTLIGLAVAAIVVLWLVFSVLKKVVGFALVAAIVAAGAFLWFNPGIAQQLLSYFQR